MENRRFEGSFVRVLDRIGSQASSFVRRPFSWRAVGMME